MSDIYNHLHENKDLLSSSDITMIEAMKEAAFKYCIDYTGDPLIVDKEPATVAILTLIAEMWDNRSMLVNSSMKTNPLIENILGMYSVNLLAGD